MDKNKPTDMFNKIKQDCIKSRNVSWIVYGKHLANPGVNFLSSLNLHFWAIVEFVSKCSHAVSI